MPSGKKVKSYKNKDKSFFSDRRDIPELEPELEPEPEPEQESSRIAKKR